MGSRFGPQGASIRFALGFLLISGTVSTGCVNKDGAPLPPGLMSFPIAIELSVDEDADGNPKYAYVTSSNFGLQYNSGNVQSYDLEKVVEAIYAECVGAGVKEECLETDYEGDINDPDCGCDPEADAACAAIPPDRCSVVPASLQFRDLGAALRLVPVEGLLRAEVEIGSFSDGLGVATDGRRLYVPVRSDANLTFIDVNEEGQLSCGGEFGQLHTCTEPYRSGSIEQVNPTVDLTLPSDPVDVYVGDLAADFAPPNNPDDPAFRGDYILMAHREGNASLFLDQLRPGGPEPQARPRLAATLDELAAEQVTITYEPGAKRALAAERADHTDHARGHWHRRPHAELLVRRGDAPSHGPRHRKQQPRYPLRPPARPESRVHRVAFTRSPGRGSQRCGRRRPEHGRADIDLP